MGDGLEFHPAHFPGRAPVDAYGNNGFRFADMSHRGHILCLPSGIYGWNVEAENALMIGSFEQVFAETGLEILLVGTGDELIPIPAKLKTALRNSGITSDPMSTGAAVRTFNVLLAENRAVGAALLAVE